MEKIITTERLTKQYKEVTAINSIDLSVARGSISALIGKNGAGKTTLMKMLSGLITPTSGAFSICGSEPAGSFPEEQSEKIGILIENAGLLMNMTARDNLRAKAICAGREDDERIDRLLKLVSLDNQNKKKVKSFSLGMKQRLGIALALFSDPEILILDEPMNALDPEGIVELRKLLQEINRSGTTIIISSHNLPQVAKIATDYIFINSGKIMETISADELNQRCAEKGIDVEEFYLNLNEEVRSNE